MLALPLAIGWVGAVLLAFVDGRRRGAGLAAAAALSGMLAVLVYLLVSLPPGGEHVVVSGDWDAQAGIALRADALGLAFACVSVGVLLAALTFELVRGVEARVFPSLVLFLAAGLTGLFLTGDAFNFYVLFEVSMMASFALAAYGSDRREIRAASIFTVVNLLGSAVFLGAVVAIYHVEGHLDLAWVAGSTPDRVQAPRMMPAVLLLVAFSLKLGLFPFHYWVPSVYANTRPAVAAMLAGALANIGAYGLLRFGGQVLPDQLASGRNIVLFLGATTVLYGSMLAVSRRRVPEVLAYSAVAQAGYVLIGIGLGGQVGYAAAVLYALVNAVDKTLLFLASASGSAWTDRAFALGALSLAGMPPMAGFVAKLALFRAAVAAESAVLVAVLFLGSALSFVYVFQAYQHTFWVRGAPQAAGASGQSVLLAVALVLLAGGVWPEPLLALSERAALVLVPEAGR